METNMLIGILIGSGVVSLLGFIAYRVKRSFDGIVKQMSDQTTDIFSEINNTNLRIDDVHSRVDSDISEIYKTTDELYRTMEFKENEIFRSMDSRFDKTESRLKKELNN